MAEPMSTAAGGFAISKIYYAIPALFVSLVVVFLRNKPTFKNHGRMATGAIVGGSAVGFSVVFGGALAVWLGMDPQDANIAMAIGGAIGLFSFTLVKVIVNFFDRMEDKDIVEVAAEVRGMVTGNAPQRREVAEIPKPAPAPAKKKPAAKRAPAKKVVKL
jgi:hypothetical protein